MVRGERVEMGALMEPRRGDLKALAECDWRRFELLSGAEGGPSTIVVDFLRLPMNRMTFRYVDATTATVVGLVRLNSLVAKEDLRK